MSDARKIAAEEKAPVMPARAVEGGGKQRPATPTGDDGLARSKHFCGGVVRDFRRRFAHYRTDWTDGLHPRTLSAGMFMFFATFFSTLALGEFIGSETEDHIGVTEYLLMNSVAGIVFSLVGAQPFVVLRPTGPITMLITQIYGVASGVGVDFFPFLATVGLWVGALMMLVAATELSRYVRHLTRFSHDIFACFVCTIYVYDGLKGLSRHFDPSSRPPRGGHKMWGAHGVALLMVNLGATVVAFAYFFSHLGTSRSIPRRMRALFAGYNLTFAIALVAFAAALFDLDFVDYIQLPEHAHPTYMETRSYSRDWWVGASGEVSAHVAAIAIAVPIVLFFYVDQNISSQLSQARLARDLPEIGAERVSSRATRCLAARRRRRCDCARAPTTTPPCS